MTSTPISSSISATSSFSSKLMVAPGHCSPSRKVVSNIMTRSLSVLFTVVISKIPCIWCAAVDALKGSGDLAQPLSAQAHTPRRPSGADKKQPAKKQGGQGRSRNRFGTGGNRRFPVNSVHLAANQHCQTLWKPNPRPKPLTVRCRRRAFGSVLNEKCPKPQCQKIVR